MADFSPLERREGEHILDTIGRYIADYMTNHQIHDLRDAFMLLTSLDVAKYKSDTNLNLIYMTALY